jgi:hypothetical protein
MQKARGNHCIKKILTDIPSISSSWELLQTNLNDWKQWEREYSSYRTNLYRDSNPGQFFRGCGPYFYNLFAERKHCAVGAVFSIVLFLQATETMFFGTRTNGIRVCGIYSCNLLFETNSFDLNAVLLLCLVLQLQEPPSPGLEIKTFF